MLLCAALITASVAQGYAYNEAATAQLLEFLSAPRDDHRDNKDEALRAAREAMAQFITLIENGANPNIILPDGRELPLLTSVVVLDFFGVIAQTPNRVPQENDLTPAEVQEFIAATHRIIRLLLDHGANPNTCTNDGQTALFCACSPEVARLLIDYGADRSLQDNQGHTALQRCETGRLSLLENIAQGKVGGFPFGLSIDTQRNLVAHADAVIEVLKTYRID